MTARALVVLVVAGCGRLSFDSLGDAGATDDSGTTDVIPGGCIVDPFNSLDGSRWVIAFPTNSVTVVVNGTLAITPAPNITEYNGLDSTGRFDFTDGAIEVELLQATNQTSTETTLEIDYSPMYRLYFVASANRLAAIERTSADLTSENALNVANQRYWRIEHNATANSISWRTSPDRMNWTLFQSLPARAAPPIDGQVLLYAGEYAAGTPTPGAGIFDNFRVITAACP